MPFWFEKGESRRFNRVTLPAKVFITPLELIRDKQVLALGIDYFPPTVTKRIDTDQKKTHYWFSHIQEQQEVLEPVFKDLIDSAAFFGERVKELSYGKSAKAVVSDWARFNQKAKGVASVSALKQSAPKTFEYLNAMNVQLKTYYAHLFKCLESSSSTKFVLAPALPKTFKINDMMTRFEASAFAKIPLAQSMYYLHQHMSHYFKAYDEMIRDYTLRQSLKNLDECEVNLSAGGVSMLMNKRFNANARCDVYFYFGEEHRSLNVRSTLVRAESDAHFHQECNAFNFEFPDVQDQRFIQLEIERFEIRNTIGVSL